jgi:predicted amidohydrolase YtcJ
MPAADSHAHILEYGAAKQLPLEGAKSIKGWAFRVDSP